MAPKKTKSMGRLSRSKSKASQEDPNQDEVDQAGAPSPDVPATQEATNPAPNASETAAATTAAGESKTGETASPPAPTTAAAAAGAVATTTAGAASTTAAPTAAATTAAAAAAPAPTTTTTAATSSESILCSGVLRMWRGGATEGESRFAILTPDHVRYYTDEAASKGGSEERGRIDFADLEEFLEVQDGFDYVFRDSGMKYGFRCTSDSQEMWRKGFEKGLMSRLPADKLRLGPPPTEVVAPSEGGSEGSAMDPGLIRPFNKAKPPPWQSLLAENPKGWNKKKKGFTGWKPHWQCAGCLMSSTSPENPSVVFVFGKGGSQDPKVCENCYALAVPPPNAFREQAQWQGMLDNGQTAKRSPIFCVVTSYKFLQYKSLDDFMKAPQKPNKEILFSNISAVELGAEAPLARKSGIRSRMSVGAKALQGATWPIIFKGSSTSETIRCITSREDALQWITAFKNAGLMIMAEGEGDSTSHAAETKAPAEAENLSAQPAAAAPSAAEAKAVAGGAAEATTTTGTTAGAAGATGATAPTAATAPTESAAAPTGATEELLKEGSAEVRTDGSHTQESMCLRLFPSRLEVWSFERFKQSITGPNEEVPLEEIPSWTCDEASLHLSFDWSGRDFELKFKDANELQAWRYAFKKAVPGYTEIAPEEEVTTAPMFPAEPASEKTEAQEDDTLQIDERQTKSETKTQEDAPSKKLNPSTPEATGGAAATGEAEAGEGGGGGGEGGEGAAYEEVLPDIPDRPADAAPQWMKRGARLQGIMAVGYNGEFEDCFCALFSRSMEWFDPISEHLVGSIDLEDITEVEVFDDDREFVVKVHRAKTGTSFQVLQSSKATLDDWTAALEQAVAEAREAAARAPGPRAARSTLLPGEQQLREIFLRADKTGQGHVSLGGLRKLSQESQLVRDFFISIHERSMDKKEDQRLTAPLDRGKQVDIILSDMLADLEATPDRPMSWEELRARYGRWMHSNSSKSQGEVLHQGWLNLITGPTMVPVYVCILRDRLEQYSDANAAARGTGCLCRVRAEDIRSQRVMDDGLVLGLDFGEASEFKCNSGERSDRWAIALKTLSDAIGADFQASQTPELPTEASVQRGATYRTVAEVSQWEPPEWFLADSRSPMIKQWLATLKVKPVHHGVLGFHDKLSAGMGPKYCVLFKTHFDQYDKPKDAAHGRRPRRRVMLSEIRAFETMGAGFLLDAGSRKLGAHVRNNEDLITWSQALISVLAPDVDGDEAEIAGSPTAAANTGSTSNHEASPPQQQAPFSRTDRSIVDVPLPEHRRPTSPARSNSQKSVKNGLVMSVEETLEILHGQAGKILRSGHQLGFDHVNPLVAPKLTSLNRIPLASMMEKHFVVSDKICGDRTISYSDLMEKHEIRWSKVTQATARARSVSPGPASGGGGSPTSQPPRLTKEEQARNVTGKVGRESFDSRGVRRNSTRRSRREVGSSSGYKRIAGGRVGRQSIAGKITEGGRAFKEVLTPSAMTGR